MTVKEHYDTHLGNFYSWMASDFDTRQNEYREFLEENHIGPSSSFSGIAIDLGAGHGVQSVALAKLGFKVKAIDFSTHLLDELKANASGLTIDVIEDDITHIVKYNTLRPELLVCWGDTLTHLQSKPAIYAFLTDACITLARGGKLILSFRDYSTSVSGDNRFFPVKNDDNRILTCLLEYNDTHVMVTDLLHEKTTGGWQQKVSSYQKTRVSPDDVLSVLKKRSMEIILVTELNRMFTIIAAKPL